MKNWEYRYLWLILLLFFIDRLSKYLVQALLGNDSYKLVDGFLCIGVRYNSGVAFGLRGIPSSVVIAIGVVILVAMVFAFDWKDGIPLSFISAGILGNIVDRVFYGHVVDFICIKWWYVFNLADLFVCFGGLLVIIDVWCRKT